VHMSVFFHALVLTCVSHMEELRMYALYVYI